MSDFVIDREFGSGKGIISTRNRFLAWAEREGKIRTHGAKIELARTSPSPPPQPAQRARELIDFGKAVIVPVAIPGCGKTTVAVALAKIFDNWGHTQSDDVKVKKAAPVFIKNVVSLLHKHDVVIADK